jgi:hypothetical protein
MNWEYKTIRFDKRNYIAGPLDIEALDKKLNAYGKMGWELVVFETRTALLGNELAVVAIFKREALQGSK